MYPPDRTATPSAAALAGSETHPLAHGCPGYDVIDQVGGGLNHAPRTASGTKSALSTGKGHQLLIGAVCATQAQKTVGQNTAIEKSIELVFDKLWETRPGLALDLGEEGLGMLLYQLVQRRLFGTPALVVYTWSCRLSLSRFVHRP